MKISTNKKELEELGACKSGYRVFVNAHGDNNALFSQCLDSNGWNDVLWLISNVYDQLSDVQKCDLRLLGCDWAESVLHLFEKKYPEDKRPRKAIEASRKFARGEIDDAAVDTASNAFRFTDVARVARDAASVVRDAARASRDAARASRDAARAATWDAAWSASTAAAWDAARENQISDLKALFHKWESQRGEYS